MSGTSDRNDAPLAATAAPPVEPTPAVAGAPHDATAGTGGDHPASAPGPDGERPVSAEPSPPAPPGAVAGRAAASDGGRGTRLFPLIAVPFWAAIAARTVADTGPPVGWGERLAVGALLLFGLLLVAERPLSSRVAWFRHGYFALQGGLVLALFFLLRDPDRDYFATLFIPLCGQAILLLPRAAGYRWIGVFTVAACSGLLVALGWPGSLPFVLLYAASYAFVASYALLIDRAETAREQSRRLLTDLQAAYRQLARSAAQAEALAAAEERTRLARDLHDSATQTLFGLTLSAEAATRELAHGRTRSAAIHVGEVRDSARRALSELRLVVFELRPSTLAEEGLAASLRARLAAVEGRAGLTTDLRVEGDERLPALVEGELDRIAQEALNNALKHARARRIAVHLRQAAPTASLAVADDGVGFDPAAPAAGGLGLRGMAERAARIGGVLAIVSAPGAGTRVRVEVPR